MIRRSRNLVRPFVERTTNKARSATGGLHFACLFRFAKGFSVTRLVRFANGSRSEQRRTTSGTTNRSNRSPVWFICLYVRCSLRERVNEDWCTMNIAKSGTRSSFATFVVLHMFATRTIRRSRKWKSNDRTKHCEQNIPNPFYLLLCSSTPSNHSPCSFRFRRIVHPFFSRPFDFSLCSLFIVHCSRSERVNGWMKNHEWRTTTSRTMNQAKFRMFARSSFLVLFDFVESNIAKSGTRN